ncbi:MAG: glycoside hydrolase family 28 protein [Opitutaceae bacterium]|nr:glycoside hydrolase family 28 protein [Opitutaceae bacterium]
MTLSDHGARPGLPNAQTACLQAALDACATAGGGTVTVPAGTFVTGTLRLRDHVTLHLENGAVLKGSANLADYPEVIGGFTDAVGQARNRCLIYAQDAVGVAITGQGTLDGNGAEFAHDAPGRPFLLRMIDCRDVQVVGVTLRDSPGWVSHYLGCENVLLSGLTIRSHANSNNDGIDIDSCRRVRVIACDLDTGDDAICLKSTRATPCENIVITGCVIRSTWGALKLGTESAGDFRNIVISDCVIRETCGGALKIISMDGARIENVSVSNLILDRVSGPIFIRLGSRLRRYHADQPARDVGCIRGVTLRNITGTVWEEGYPLYGKLPRKAGIIVTGLPGHCIEDLHVSDVRLTFPGGGTPADAARRDVPEQPEEYPEFPSFHPLPAWGLFLRHARHVTLRDVDLRLADGATDARPATFTNDVTALRSTAVLGSHLS